MTLFSNSFGQNQQVVDMIITNSVIYSADKDNSIFSAMVIDKGKILVLGSDKEIKKKFRSDYVMDAGGKPVFPGFIDAHSHFYGYALGLKQSDLTGTASFEEVVQKIREFAKNYHGDWLTGRGWDHNDWKEKQFPDRKLLDELFPDRPVVLIRIDGHVLLANGEALRRTGLDTNSSFLPDEIEKKDGWMTGILGENAADYMRNKIPEPEGENLINLIKQAQENCLAVGLTTVDDAGADKKTIFYLDSLQKSGILKLRLSVMVNPTEENFEYFFKKGVFRTDRLTAGAVKLYADGSLGSRSALMKKPYSDDPSKSGIQTTPVARIREVCAMALRSGYQVCIHAIGDSAVKEVLDIYSAFLAGKNDLRWRIEHSQVVDPADFHLFAENSIIPSVQATHATSDMYWAGQRIGPERMKGAYAYETLLQQNGWLPNGTDFPIENISPLYTFYASVARKDLKGYPEGGFQMENALSREQALRSITIWAAMASFDEKSRGSLEPGKEADFVILEKDIMKVPEKEIPETKVVSTFISGEKVH